MSEDNDIFWLIRGDGIAIILFILLLPVIPAGDLGLAFAASLGKHTSLITYIIFWFIFAGGYGAFLIYIVGGVFLQDFGTFIRIVVYYTQGVIFSYMVAPLEGALVSPTLVKVFDAIGSALFSPVG